MERHQFAALMMTLLPIAIVAGIVGTVYCKKQKAYMSSIACAAVVILAMVRLLVYGWMTAASM